VRMDAGQDLAAVATDIGVDPQTLIDALVESWSPAIDDLLASGEITEAEAERYREALEEAFTFRVDRAPRPRGRRRAVVGRRQRAPGPAG